MAHGWGGRASVCRFSRQHGVRLQMSTAVAGGEGFVTRQHSLVAGCRKRRRCFWAHAEVACYGPR